MKILLTGKIGSGKHMIAKNFLGRDFTVTDSIKKDDIEKSDVIILKNIDDIETVTNMFPDTAFYLHYVKSDQNERLINYTVRQHMNGISEKDAKQQFEEIEEKESSLYDELETEIQNKNVKTANDNITGMFVLEHYFNINEITKHVEQIKNHTFKRNVITDIVRTCKNNNHLVCKDNKICVFQAGNDSSNIHSEENIKLVSDDYFVDMVLRDGELLSAILQDYILLLKKIKPQILQSINELANNN